MGGEAFEHLVIDEIVVLRVLDDERLDVRAEGDDPHSLGSRRVERARGQFAGESSPTEGRIDLGVDEDQPPGSSNVLRKADALAVRRDLEAVLGGVVAHVSHRCGS